MPLETTHLYALAFCRHRHFINVLIIIIIIIIFFFNYYYYYYYYYMTGCAMCQLRQVKPMGDGKFDPYTI